MGIKCCHAPLDEKNAKVLLSASGLNRTRVKIDLLKALSKSKKPLSVTDLHSLLKESCDISTIFRTINQFKEKNIIQEINLEEGFFRYEMNSSDSNNTSHHHHHVLCRKCGDIKQIEKCDLAMFEKAISKLGFKDMEHRLEFTGICSKCK